MKKGKKKKKMDPPVSIWDQIGIWCQEETYNEIEN